MANGYAACREKLEEIRAVLQRVVDESLAYDDCLDDYFNGDDCIGQAGNLDAAVLAAVRALEE